VTRVVIEATRVTRFNQVIVASSI